MAAPPSESPDHTVTRSLDDWAVVMNALVLIAHSTDPTAREAARIGKEIAESCPNGSAPRFGAALFPPDPEKP